MYIYLDIHIYLSRMHVSAYCTGLRSLLFLVRKPSCLNDKKKTVPNRVHVLVELPL